MEKSLEYLYFEEKLDIISNLTEKNTIILTTSPNLKTFLPSFSSNIFSQKEFYEYIIRKSPTITNIKTLSQNTAMYIIKHITSSTFKGNKALFVLSESVPFLNELYELFGSFISNGISPNYLFSVLSEMEISETDKRRLQLIFNTFESYLQKIKELNYTDKRVLPKLVLQLINESNDYKKILQSKFKNIIIDNISNLTNEEKELLNEIAQNICFISHKLDASELENDFNGDDIATRAFAIIDKYWGKNTNIELKPSNKISYKEFRDLKDEIETIADEIVENVTSKKMEFKDFTIVSANKDTNKLIENVFLLKNIPTSISFEDATFKNFSLKLIDYLNICSVLQKLGANDIYETNIRNFNINSKYKIENCFDEINISFENILSSCLENQFSKDKILNIKSIKNGISLISASKINMEILPLADKNMLEKELAKLEFVFELFKQNKINDIVIYCAKNTTEKSEQFNNYLANLLSKLKTITNLSLKLKNKLPEISEILEIINEPVYEKIENKNSVRITPYEKNDYKRSKKLYMVDLTTNNIPKAEKNIQFISEESDNKISSRIRVDFETFEGFLNNPQKQLQNEALSFAKSMLNTKETLHLSTHIYEDKKELQPSSFFLYLNSIDKENSVQKIHTKTENSEVQTQLPLLTEAKNEIVLDENEILKLSASAISTFQNCPRKFYYKYLLKLKEISTFAANYGTLAHKIMEVFSKNYLEEYSKETLILLADKIFNAQIEPDEALSVGFSTLDVELVQSTDSLKLTEMKEQFLSAINELEGSGFFNKIPEKITCEQTFSFELEKLPNTLFDGRIDAVYKFEDEYEIADFKTGAKKPELSYIISEKGVNFITKSGTYNPDLQNKFEYQIPIYYLATQNSKDLETIKDKIKEYYLLYIKPKNKGGVSKDNIEATTLTEFENKIVENLKTTIIDKIRSQSYFEAELNTLKCQNCGFKILCDEKSSGGNDE